MKLKQRQTFQMLLIYVIVWPQWPRHVATVGATTTHTHRVDVNLRMLFEHVVHEHAASYETNRTTQALVEEFLVFLGGYTWYKAILL